MEVFAYFQTVMCKGNILSKMAKSQKWAFAATLALICIDFDLFLFLPVVWPVKPPF